MRLHQPTGIYLLLWPCLWAVTLASEGVPQLSIIILFAVGAVVMRAAGCIVNDIIDRNIDKQVARTRSRPLASGMATVSQAVALLLILVAIGAIVAFLLGSQVVLYSMLALIPVCIYPFMKRITWWPQLFLGITFNLGAIIGWVAIRGQVELAAILLYIGSIAWTVGYDTIYAHQDKEDDAKIGVKSTALYFGKNTLYWLILFYGIAMLSWCGVGYVTGVSNVYFIGMCGVAFDFCWQIRRFSSAGNNGFAPLFRHNGVLGGVLWGVMLLEYTQP